MGVSNIHRRGFASLSAERRKEIAAQGGRRAHEAGKAHHWTSATAVEAAKKAVAARKARKAFSLGQDWVTKVTNSTDPEPPPVLGAGVSS